MNSDLGPVFPPSNPQVSLWRYLDLGKFLALLHSQSLYFCRADLIGDPFEGSYPRATHDTRQQFIDAFGRDSLDNPERSRMTERFRVTMFLNCWHMSEHESASMWASYGQGGHAIAIRSTYRRLVDALPDDTIVGVVKYIDYDHDCIETGNILTPLMHKRQSFAAERELRALLWRDAYMRQAIRGEDMHDVPVGEHVPVDLEALLTGIYLSPRAPAWLQEALHDTCARFGLSRGVRHSDMDSSPLF